MTFSPDEFDDIVALAIRKVKTPEGSKYYDLPIGAPITADAIAKAKIKHGGAPQPKDSSGGQSGNLGTKFNPLTGKMNPGPKLSPEENYGTSNGVTLKESSLKGPNSFKVGDSTFNAPAGSRLIRSKTKKDIAYVLTPDGEVHAFSVTGEVEIPEYVSSILSEKFSNLKKDDPNYSLEEFDVDEAASLKDQKVGAELRLDGEVAFKKTGDNTWEHSALGIVLTDDDLQPQFDAGKFELSAVESGEVDFSKLTSEEIDAILEGFDPGKKLTMTIGGKSSVIQKNDENAWINTEAPGHAGLSSKLLADMVAGTDWLSEKVPSKEEENGEEAGSNGTGSPGVPSVPGSGGGDSGSGGSDGPGDSDDEGDEPIGEKHAGFDIPQETLDKVVDLLDESRKIAAVKEILTDLKPEIAKVASGGGIAEAKQIVDSIEKKHSFHIDGKRIRTSKKFTENERSSAIQAAGGSTPPVFKLEKNAENAKLFREQMLKSLEGNPYSASVYVYDEEEYNDMDLFLADDGLSGIAIHNGDEIVSVFSTPKSKNEKVARHLISVAVLNGGTRLDAFDTVLPKIYAAEGFTVKSRLKWNDEYAPEGWDKNTFGKFNNGEPDVVFMSYDPEAVDSVYTPGEGKYVDTYEDGLLSTNSDEVSDEPQTPEGDSVLDEDAYVSVVPDNLKKDGPVESYGEALDDVISSLIPELHPDIGNREFFTEAHDNSHSGKELAVARDDEGRIVGYLVYYETRFDTPEDLAELEEGEDPYPNSLTVTGLYGTPGVKGAGSALMEHVARVAVANKAELYVQGAVKSAKSFYAQKGATMDDHSSVGEWSEASLKKLAGEHTSITAEAPATADDADDFEEEEVSVPEGAKAVKSLDDLNPGAEIYVDLDGQMTSKFVQQEDGTWTSPDYYNTPFTSESMQYDVDAGSVYATEDQFKASEETDPFLDLLANYKPEEVKGEEKKSNSFEDVVEKKKQKILTKHDLPEGLNPEVKKMTQEDIKAHGEKGGHTDTLGGTYSANVIGLVEPGAYSHEMGHAIDEHFGLLTNGKKAGTDEYKFWQAAKLTPEMLEGTSFLQNNPHEFWAYSYDDWIDGKTSPALTKAFDDFFESKGLLKKNSPSTPSDEDAPTSTLSDADKQSAIEALESHSGFQIKYGLKNLPETHPLKNEETLKAEVDAAKEAYPDLPPKKAFVAYLKGEKPLEPLADWEKELLEGENTIQIGSENPKKVVQGVTGGVFTQKEIQDAIDILENYPGKVFKSELVKKGSPLGALSPNDIIGFEKDKLVGKQKYIDFLKGKLAKSKEETAPKTIDEAIEADDMGLLDEPSEISLDDFEFSTATEEQVSKLPIGTTVYFKSNNGEEQVWEKTDENKWSWTSDPSYFYSDKVMASSFNEDSYGWSKDSSNNEEDSTENTNFENGHSLISSDTAKKVGGQAGSNTGGLYELDTPDGVKKFYVKKAQTEDHGKNEALANALYQELGVNAPNVDFASDGNIYSEIVEGKHDMEYQMKSKFGGPWMDKIRKDFAIDAWLSNRDVFGMTYDNILTDSDGNPWKIDNGGALKYRAQGQPKNDFTADDVPELDVFKTGKKSLVFGEGVMTKEQELDGVNRLAKLSPDRIDQLVTEYGLDAEMADILKGRRKFVLDRYGVNDPFAEGPEPDAFDADTVEPGYTFKSVKELDALKPGQQVRVKNINLFWTKNEDGTFAEPVSGVQNVPSSTFAPSINSGSLEYYEKTEFQDLDTPEESGDAPEPEYVNGIAPGKYNTGKGAKAHLYVKSDGTGVYTGMKGLVKELDAEGVKKNYDAGMNVFVESVDDANVPGSGGAVTTTAQASKVIPNLGNVDELPDGTYDGPMGVTYTVSGDDVFASKPVKSLNYLEKKVGQVPNAQTKENAPVGTKFVFSSWSGGPQYYVTKQEDGTWKGDEVAENYLSHIDNIYSWKHKNWKIASFPQGDAKKSAKTSIKSKYLQAQLVDPETKTSVIPTGYSGSVTFFGGPTDIASLASYRDYLKDDDIPLSTKASAHTNFGVPMDVALIKNYVNKKHGVEESSGQEQLEYIVEELDSFLSKAKLPEAQDFSKVFQKDEHGAVIKPLEIATLTKPSWYDGTGIWSNYIKEVSAAFGDGKLIGVNMPGATKDDKSLWASYFETGDFGSMYKLELDVAKGKGKTHPTGVAHPGHPDNKDTHNVTWGAAVQGEVPAGTTVPGTWSSLSVDASMEEINNYLISAKMQNPTHLSTYEKRTWVNSHRKGQKATVDHLSAVAALRAKNGETPLTDPPVWTDDVKPAKSYDSLFDTTEFPQNWTQGYLNMQKAEDFYNDNVAEIPELENIFHQKQAENPYGNIHAETVQAYFAKKEEEYLEELNKPVWEVKKTISEGSHPTFIVKDQKSEKMKIFKPTTPGKEWRADSEAAAHNLGAMLGFNVPGATIGEVNEGIPMGSNNKGIVMDFAPNVGSLGNVDGAEVDLKTLTPEQFGQLAKEHVFDWFLDNDDTHHENMLIGTDGNLVAIDKGRAFIQYGHWHGLDVDNPDALNVNTKDSPGRKSVVYSDMIKAIKSGKISQEQLDEAYKQAMKAAKRVQKSDDNTIASFVRSATDGRDNWDVPSYAKDWDFLTPHPTNQDELVASVLARKNSMVEDFEKFYEKLYAEAGFFKPEPPAKVLGEEHLSGWEEPDVLTKTEEAKVWGAAPIHASAAFAEGASLLWTEKDTNGNSVISGKIKLGNITQQKVMDFMASKLSPYSGVSTTSSLKEYPTAHVKQWKKTVTAVGKDLSNNATTGDYNETLWNDMKSVEAKVDADLEFAQTVDISDGGKASFPSGISMPTETVPMYVMALNYHKGLIANVEKAKAAKEATDKTHFQDFNPPSWKNKGNKYTSPEGWTYKELDDGNYVEVKEGIATIVPDAPDAAKSGAPGWTVEKGDASADASAEKYTLIQAGMFAGQLNEDGEKIIKSDFNTSGHPGQEYRIDLPTGEKIFFRDGNQTGTVRSQTGTVRFQLNRLIDSESSLSNVQSYLETVGIDMSGADEEQAENVYWRQMFGRIIGSDPKGASASVKNVRDKLLGMRTSLAAKVGKSVDDLDIPEAIGLTETDERTFWHNLAVEAWGAEKVNNFLAEGRHLPKYQHMDLNDPEKATGLPWFQRIDVDLEKLYGKGTMLAHGNNGKDKRHFDYIKSGAYTSTEERLRILGFYKTGASSSSDQGTGGASYVFTRVANGQALTNGAIYGKHVMYWSPEVMSMTGTYSYSSDQFGNLSLLQGSNKIDPLKSLEYSGGSNETMIPNNVSIYDFMEIMVFESENERLKAIEEFKKKGIEQLRGLPIEDRLVNRKNLDAALDKVKKAWKK